MSEGAVPFKGSRQRDEIVFTLTADYDEPNLRLLVNLFATWGWKVAVIAGDKTSTTLVLGSQ